MLRTYDNTFVTNTFVNYGPFLNNLFSTVIHHHIRGVSSMEICVYEWCNCTVQQLLILVLKIEASGGGGSFIVCKRQFTTSLKELTNTDCYCKLQDLEFDNNIGIAMEVECWFIGTYVYQQVCLRIFGSCCWTLPLSPPLDVIQMLSKRI